MINLSTVLGNIVKSIVDNPDKVSITEQVEGDEVLVYSKKDPECCYHQKHMDIVVVPASMGEYGIINLGSKPCKVHKTLLK